MQQKANKKKKRIQPMLVSPYVQPGSSAGFGSAGGGGGGSGSSSGREEATASDRRTLKRN